MKPSDALSFQMYSARTLEPLEKQFELLAGLGYRLIEPYGGLFGDVEKLRALMDRHQMRAPSAHIGMDRLRGDLKAAVKLCRRIGVEAMFAPAPLPDERGQDIAGWRTLGTELAEMGQVIQGEGLKFGWHNHHWEFAKDAHGKRGIDVMFEAAPDLLWEADLAWIIRGGADPEAEIARYSGRLVAAHIKDLAKPGEKLDEDGWADPGHGVMNWTKLRGALKTAGVKLFVVEHDKPSDVARFAKNARDEVMKWA